MRYPVHTPIRRATATLFGGLAGSLVGSALLLSGCGGGSNDNTVVGPPVVPTTVDQTVTVVDGLIKGALVCLDKNANGACDADETQGTTAADGTVKLTLPIADANKYTVLAVVPADAVDADNGVVGTAYTLKSPADKPTVVSPLTTLVAVQVDAAGGTTADAEKALQDKLGITGSLFANFSGKTDDAAKHAAAVARLVVVTTQQHNAATKDAKDSSGKALTVADLANAINQSLLAVLPSLVAAAVDPAVASAATPKDKADAISAAAAKLVTETGLSASNIAAAVAAAKLTPTPEDPAATPTAGASLRWFTYTDAQNYYYRMFKGTAAQNTVVNGKRQFTEYRERSSGSNGNVTFYQQWGEGLNNFPRNQIYWTGTEWFDCPTDFVNEATAWDAKGVSDSLYCKAYKSTSKRSERDISGLKIADVVAQIRAFPLYDSEGKYPAWGPDPVANAAKLGGNFPASSKIYTYAGIETASPDRYGTTLNNDLYTAYNALISTGNATECAKVTASNGAQFQVATSTLEGLLAAAVGKPCVFGLPSVPTGELVNEWWSNSTVNIADVVDPYSNATGYYRTGVKDLRVSFAAGNVANYWLCLRRTSDGSPRNCKAAGSGAYSIETLGDARVLRLSGQPAIAATLNFNRSFIERAGAVWYGAKSKLQTTSQLRPNLVASQALFDALGLPAPRAAAPLTANSLVANYLNSHGTGTYNKTALAVMENNNAGLTGAWTVTGGPDARGQTFFFFANGDYVMSDPVGDTGANSCGAPGHEQGRISFDAASGVVRLLSISRDTNGCAGLHDTTVPDAQQINRVLVTLTFAADGKSLVAKPADGSGPNTLVRLTK